jgi:sec-independent protein translocase protein TatB
MDSFFGIGMFELAMIAVIALIVLGPDRLPGAMREISKYVQQLRQVSGEFQSQFSEELKILDEINPKRMMNEILDPNALVNPTPTKPATSAAKPTTSSTPAQAPKPPAASLSAAAPKPATPAGESANSVLPPQAAEKTGEVSSITPVVSAEAYALAPATAQDAASEAESIA